MAKALNWTTALLDPKKIMLDIQNPRIEIQPNASQADIRLKLLNLEDVLDLARNIDKSKGLFYGERIITTVEDGKQVVLEGNRRVAACQMLLDPDVVPQAYKTRFPKVSPDTKAKISKLSSDVAPTREAAEPILTKRHTERGAKPWSPVAKMRRAVRLLEHKSVEEVAAFLGTSVGQVKKLIRPYKLLKFAWDLDCWTEDERLVLEDEKLVTNPYTRFFTLKKTQEALKLHFDNDHNPISTLPPSVFREQMERIARDFLLSDPANRNKPKCDTRTDPEVYFSSFINSPAGKTTQPSTKTSPKAQPNPGKPKPPKASVFFENLECHVQDNNLIKLTDEIKGINHTRMPIAASLLTRAIFECALVYKLKKERKWNSLINAEGRDPGLSEILKFCGNFDNKVFIEANICKILKSQTTLNAKKYLDGMTHLKYQEADAPTLESVANNIRQIIQYILAGN